MKFKNSGPRGCGVMRQYNFGAREVEVARSAVAVTALLHCLKRKEAALQPTVVSPRFQNGKPVDAHRPGYISHYLSRRHAQV